MGWVDLVPKSGTLESMSDACCDDLIEKARPIPGVIELFFANTRINTQIVMIQRGVLGIMMDILDEYESRLSAWALSSEKDTSYLQGLSHGFNLLVPILSQMSKLYQRPAGLVETILVRRLGRRVLEKYEDLRGFIRSFTIPPGETISHEELMRSAG